jgi:hypothetical protein
VSAAGTTRLPRSTRVRTRSRLRCWTRPGVRRLAGTARHLHPDRSPFRPDGGVAGRGRPGRELVPASHQPRRDPHLHVHVAVWNRVQHADRADEKWRTLDSRSLHNQRLAVAPVPGRSVESRLSALGYAMVPRADGNGAEVGGVSQDVIDTFSSRSRSLTPELKVLIDQYQKPMASRRRSGRSGCWGSRQRRTPGAPRPKPAAPSPADGCGRTDRGAAAGCVGDADDAAGNAGAVGGAPRSGPVRRADRAGSPGRARA